MKIYKNKTSGKYFIYIENTGNDEALLITSEGKIKSLKLRLFDEPQEEDEDYFLSQGLIMEVQIKRYRQYMMDVRDDVLDEMLEFYKQLASYDKKRYWDMIKKTFNKEWVELAIDFFKARGEL